MKKRLYINAEGQVVMFYLDNWNEKEYDVPDDFEENFTRGIPYRLENGKILVDSAEQERRKIQEKIAEKELYLADTNDAVIEAQEYTAIGKEIPQELLVRIKKRQKLRKEIAEFREGIPDEHTN